MNNITFEELYEYIKENEEFGSDADRLMRKLFDQTHKEK